MAGVFRYFINSRLTLSARGTFVWPSYRKRGVARALWQLALDESSARTVCVDVVTDRGWTLVQALKRDNPDVWFDVYNGGERPPRLLKKRA